MILPPSWDYKYATPYPGLVFGLFCFLIFFKRVVSPSYPDLPQVHFPPTSAFCSCWDYRPKLPLFNFRLD